MQSCSLIYSTLWCPATQPISPVSYKHGCKQGLQTPITYSYLISPHAHLNSFTHTMHSHNCEVYTLCSLMFHDLVLHSQFWFFSSSCCLHILWLLPIFLTMSLLNVLYLLLHNKNIEPLHLYPYLVPVNTKPTCCLISPDLFCFLDVR